MGLLLLVLVSKVMDVADSFDNEGYELNKRVNERNQQYAKANVFGFTDKERATRKPKGVYRIAVLRDSFIWGDGLPYEKVWSHKLERRLEMNYDSIEVLSWGRCGWSTLDEFNFFKEHGKDYDIDLLIVAWVDNDPDMGKIPQQYNGDAKGTYPVRYFISPALAQSALNRDNIEAGQVWWKGIYSAENLKDYQVVLNEFHQYLEDSHVQSLVVMTMPGFGSEGLERFNRARPLIINAGFPCLDLYEPVKHKLGHYKPSELQANPVNSHPGELLTEEFALEAGEYLSQNHYLDYLPKREK